ncbi:MAG: AraC family transcriptional regulator [Chloroflexota bacterium]
MNTNLNLKPSSDSISITSHDGDLIQAFAQGLNLTPSGASDMEKQPQSPSSGTALRVDLPDDIGSGWVQQMALRPGMEARIVDFSFKHPLLIQSRHRPTTMIQLGFWQQGEGIHYRFGFDAGITESGEASFSSIPVPFESEALFPRNSAVQGVSLLIDPDILRDWLKNIPLPQPLHQLLHANNGSQIVTHREPIPSQLAQPLFQLRHAIWQGPMLQLYTEAKMLELIALYATHLTRQVDPPPMVLTQDDVDRLHEAKRILLSRIDNPLSLLELAQAVHLNDHKLKVGFKMVFGTTVFGMLYDHRMQTARELLEDRHFSIGEIALEVGYRSQSAFSTAFKRKYGISPRDLRP